MKLLIIGIWLFAIAYVSGHREIGVWGVETDWYGCYAPQAEAFAESGTIPIDNFRGPIYQMTLGAVSLLPISTWRAGQVINVLCAVACIGLLLALCNALGVYGVGVIIALVAMLITPAFIEAAVSNGTDMFFLALVLASLWAIIADKPVCVGVFISLAILTRTNGIALLLPALIMMRPWRWMPIVATAIASWGLFTLFKTGDFFHNLNYLNTAALITDSGKLEDLWYAGYGNFTGWIDLFRLDVLAALFYNAQSVFSGIYTSLWYFPLSALGIWGMCRIQKTTLLEYMIACIPLLFLISYSDRYALTLVPLFAIGLGKLCDLSYTPALRY